MYCGVTLPSACGIGGGGCMIIYDPDSDTYTSYNYYASAPVSYSSKQSSFGVPGLVAGMEEVNNDYGTIEMSDLISYAYDLAENGFIIDSNMESMIYSYSNYLLSYSNLFNEDEEFLQEGDILYQKELANNLKIIQEEGSQAFYTGSIAEKLSSTTYLTLDDLANYKVDKQEAVHGSFYDYDIYSAPAPFGGVTLIQMMKMFELTDIENPEIDSSSYLNTLNKITAVTTNDKINNVADPNYIYVDSDKLTSTNYIESLLENNDIEYLEDDEETEDTTAFSVIDENGMIVSCTMTIGDYWGSKEIVDGIVLNACLNNFSESSTVVNSYYPGKKPRSYITPTIIKGEDYTLSIGSPGGIKIVKILSQVLLDNLKFETDIQSAINKNRVLFTDYNLLAVENDEERQDFVNINNSGFTIIYKSGNYFGAVNATGYSSDLGFFGAFDSRRRWEGWYKVKA